MAKRQRNPRDYFNCPNCGAEVSQDAEFCRACGASNESGWSDDEGPEEYGADDFDYDDFIRREFPDQAPLRTKVSGKSVVIGVIVLLVVMALVISMLH